MMSLAKTALVAGLALGGLGSIGAASAMPAQGLQTAIATAADTPQVENVRLICRPYRGCYHVPGFGYGYGYRPYGFYRPYGYHPFYRRRFFY